MAKLTDREKMLLSVLFTGFILVLGIMYWVLPMKSDIDAIAVEKQELELQKLDMELKIAQTNKLLSNKDELTDEVNQLMNQMSDPLLGETFDLQIQGFSNLHNMTINSVQYGATQATMPSATGTPTQVYEYNLKELVQIVTGSKDENLDSMTTENEVLKKTITIQMDGTYLGVQKILGEINSMGNTYYVKNVVYSRTDTELKDEASGLVVTEETTETATIEVDVYFIKMDTSSDGMLSQKS